ncbi:MAG: hypothetical protein ABI672_19290 [Vicinamibacteria bacterium]
MAPTAVVHISGLIAAMEGDEDATTNALRGVIKDHRKEVRNRPGHLEGLVSYSAMSICRVALWNGLVIEEQPYLPLCFMPGHPLNKGFA